jgi:hypothetical protein
LIFKFRDAIGIKAKRSVDRLLRQIGDRGDARGIDDAHQKFVGTEIHRHDPLRTCLGRPQRP